MERTRKFLDIGSNAAILLVAIAITYVLVDRQFMQPTTSVQSKPAPVLKAGDSLLSSPIDWTKGEKNLVLVLSAKCRFCSESMPFYRTIADRKTSNRELRMIALMPQEFGEASRYLDDGQVSVDEVVRLNPGSINVRGTPTLILVDREGVVLKTWIGKLTVEQEVDVLSNLFGTSPNV